MSLCALRRGAAVLAFFDDDPEPQGSPQRPALLACPLLEAAVVGRLGDDALLARLRAAYWGELAAAGEGAAAARLLGPSCESLGIEGCGGHHHRRLLPHLRELGLQALHGHSTVLAASASHLLFRVHPTDARHDGAAVTPVGDVARLAAAIMTAGSRCSPAALFHVPEHEIQAVTACVRDRADGVVAAYTEASDSARGLIARALLSSDSAVAHFAPYFDFTTREDLLR